MAHDPVQLGREVLGACRALGFGLAGIAAAARSDREESVRAWLRAGKHGTMAWMEERLEERLDVGVMLPGAKSVVMVGDVYAGRGEAEGESEGGGAAGRVARYARGRDYHVVMKRRLHRLADELRRRFGGEEFRVFVDSGPVLEREHAARAGLGWIGKHTLLIHPEIGSYVLLGGMATTLELRAPAGEGAGGEGGVMPDHCGTCTRCIDACPTGAIEPYGVDARRCISYLTIEHAGRIERELEERMGGWVFGCDVCQEVCPYNAGRGESGAAAHPAYGPKVARLGIVEVLRWDEEAHRRATSGSALKRASLEMLKRNAVAAAERAVRGGENGGILAELRRVAADESGAPLVREAAAGVLERLGEVPDVWKKPRYPEGEGAAGRET